MNPFILKENVVWLLPLIVWTLFWKGLAIWTAVKREDKGWFIAILVLNTVGILEIIYFFGVTKKKWSDVKTLFTKLSSSAQSK